MMHHGASLKLLPFCTWRSFMQTFRGIVVFSIIPSTYQIWVWPPDFAATRQSCNVYQGSAILSESVRNRDTGEPGISISIDFGKFPVSVSVSESIITKIWYPTQWFWAFHQNLCYKTCLTLVSVSESESKFSLFLVSVSVSKSTRHRKSLSIEIGIEKASIAGSCYSNDQA